MQAGCFARGSDRETSSLHVRVGAAMARFPRNRKDAPDTAGLATALLDAAARRVPIARATPDR